MYRTTLLDVPSSARRHRQTNLPNVLPPSMFADCHHALAAVMPACHHLAGLELGGADACQGDSGGPLISRSGASAKTDRLRGLVSWGAGCGEAGKPGVYTDMVQHRTWVEEKLKVGVGVGVGEGVGRVEVVSDMQM